MYDPQEGALDFEIGAFGDRLKKVGKKAMKGLAKVTEATIVKPSAMIGGAIGGKRGRELGRKLGKLTQKATHFGVAAGAAGAAAPILTSPTALTAIGAGIAGKKLKQKLSKRKAKRAKTGKKPKGAMSRGLKRSIKKAKGKASTSCSNSDAAKIGAMLTKILGGPLSEANKALKLAAIQRAATYEHNKLMTDAEFRKRVLQGITNLAADGNTACERTIRVIMAR